MNSDLNYNNPTEETTINEQIKEFQESAADYIPGQPTSHLIQHGHSAIGFATTEFVNGRFSVENAKTTVPYGLNQDTTLAKLDNGYKVYLTIVAPN